MEDPQVAVVDQVDTSVVDPPAKVLHESMVRNGYPVPDYNTFVSDMEDPAKVAALHKSLIAHGKKLPDLSTFFKDMSFGTPPTTWGEQQGTELKKKEEARSRQAGKPFSFGSSVVDAQTAAETYSPDTKQSVKEKEDRAALSKTYDDTTTIDDVDAQGNDIKANRQLSLLDAYKAYGAATGRADDLQFREQKINSQQYNAETTVMSRLFSPKENWTGPADPISAPASRESYNLFKDAYQAKSKIIKNKLDELHDDPISSQMLDGAHEAQDVLGQIAEIEKTGQYNGRLLSTAEYNGIIANKAEYQAHEKAIRSTPQGAAAFKLLDNINSLDADEQRFNQTFGGFIAEDKSASAEQDKVDKLYDDAPWFVKGAYSIGQPVGRAATGFAAKLLTIQDLWTAGDNEYHLSGDQWKDTVNDWKKSIDNELFHQPRSFDEDAFKYEGGSIKLTDDQGRIKPEIKLPTGISVNRGSILPQTAKTFAECIALVAPAGLVSKAAKALGVSKTILGADIGYSVGLVSSSYVSKHDEVFNAALEAGLSREDAAYHARTGALIEASLELVSPQRYLTIGRGVGATVKELAKGAGKTVGRTAGFLAKETGGEVTQETLQSMGDFANQAYRNKTLGKEYFDVSMNKLAKELGQVIPLTAIMAGTTSGAHAMTNPLYSEAVRAAADDPEIIPRLLTEFKKKGTPEQAIKKVLQDIGSVVKYEDGQIGYVNTAHNIPLTKEQATSMIADGNIGDLNIYGDEEMQSALEQKHQEQMLKRDQVDQKTATKIVKASDGTSSIVLKSDQTKIVGTIKDGVTTLLDGQGQPATSSAVEEQAPAKPQKIQTIDELIRDNQIAVVDEKQAKLMMADKTNPANSKLGRVITNIQSAMSKINPSGRLVMLNSQEHAVATARKLGYSVEDGATVKGFYDPNTKTAFFVKNPNTTIHEAAIHPIIDMIKHEAPEKYQGFVDEIGSIMSGYDSDGSGRYYLKDAQKNYKGDSKARQSEEAIVSFLTDVAAGRFNERTGLEKIVQAVKAFLGLSEKEMMINLSDPQTLQDFAGQIATALSKGQAITIKPIAKEAQKKSEVVKFSKEQLGDLTDTNDAEAFHQAIKAAVSGRTEDGVQVEVKPVDIYKQIIDAGGKLYLSKDGQVGGYVDVDGYIGSLFKHPESTTKGAAKALLSRAVADGGIFMDAFGTYLEPLYIKSGFEPVARMPFKEEFAPDGWQNTTLKTKPDVVFFAYNPDNKSKVGDGKLFDDWDQAINFTQDKAHEYETQRTNTGGEGRSKGEGKSGQSVRGDVSKESGTDQAGIDQEVKFQKESYGATGTTGEEPVINGQGQSTRTPTTVYRDKAIGDHTKEQLSVSLNDQRKAPASYVKNSILIGDYPALQGQFRSEVDQMANRVQTNDKNVTPEDLTIADSIFGDLKKKIVDNLLWLHDQFPADIRDRARRWYDGANRLAQQMAKNYNISLEQASAVFAVLSPQKDWYMNVSLGERVTDIFTNQQNTIADEAMTKRVVKLAKSLKNTTNMNPKAFRASKKKAVVKAIAFASETGKTLSQIEAPEFKAMFIRSFDEMNNPRSYSIITPEGRKEGSYQSSAGDGGVAWGAYPTIIKAINILTDGSKENISNQLGEEHKVRNFYNNIANPNSKAGEVTIDTHATAAGLLQALSGNSTAVGAVFGNTKGASSSKYNGISGSYAVFADAYREAAAKVNLLPREMQSITWEAVRRLFTSSFKSQAKNVDLIDRIWKEYENKNITIDELRSAITEVANPVWRPDWAGRNSEQPNQNQDSADSGLVSSDVLHSRSSSESSTTGSSRPVSALVSRLTDDGVKFHKEVSETTKRVVEPPTTVFQDLRTQYLHNPLDSTFSTERQSIGDEKIRMAAMDDQQALQNMADKGTHELYDIIDQLKATDNFGLLAAIEVMKRATAANDQQLASAVYEKLNKLGSGVGQLLRQMRELKSVYPPSADRQTRMANDRDLIRSIILKKYAKEGIVLPRDQKLALDGLIGNYVAAHELEIAAADKFTRSPTKANSDAHVKAVDYTDKKHYALIDFVDNTIPTGVGNTIWTIIKGNLLTAGSIGVNTISNVANAVNQVGIEGVAASFYGELSKDEAGQKTSFNPLNYPVAVGQAMKAFVKAWRPAFREAFTRGSMRSRDLQKFEIQRQLQPAKAFIQAFINPRALPKKVVTKNGRTTYETTATIWAEKALEGTFGWPAAFFYRMLYLTDKPFKEAGKTFAGYLEYQSEHPNGKASGFASWMANLDPKAKANIERYADKFTYNDPEGMIAKTASQVVGSVDKVADWMESLDKPIPLIPTIMRAIKTAVVPYVGVPSNIVQHLLELAFPPAALMSAAYHHRSGEHRIAGMMVGRALTGATLYAVASILSKAGLLIDNDDDPTEKNDMQLKHAVARPAAINLSGLIRLWAGQDTAWRVGDRSIDMQKVGMTGVFLNYYANFSQAMGERRMEDFNANMMDALAQATGSTLKTAFSMSFLKGTFTTLESLAGADKEGAKGMTAFTAKTIETLSALIWPNQLSQIHQAYNQPMMMRAFDSSLLGNIREKMAKRGFYFGVLSTDKLQPVLDIWGAPIPIKPSDILDPSKLEVATDQEAIKVWNLMNETHADNPLTIPMNIIKLSADDNIDGIETDTNMKLDEADYLTLQALVGRFKKAYLRNEFADSAFDGLPNNEKLDIIKEANSDANLAGRKLFLDMFYKEIDDGNIVFDAQKGIYTRKTETKFEPQTGQRLIAADGSEIPQN